MVVINDTMTIELRRTGETAKLTMTALRHGIDAVKGCLRDALADSA